MSETRAVPLDQLVSANMQGPYPLPLCPACRGGRLYPYRVTITVSTVRDYYGADWIEGWVAVCEGNTAYKRAWHEAHPDHTSEEDPDVPACGFSMPMTPHKHQRVTPPPPPAMNMVSTPTPPRRNQP